MAAHLLQRMHLEIQRTGAVDDHVMLVDPVGQVDAVAAAREQVDRRGAERHQLLRVHRALQALVVLAEQHDQFQLLAVASTQGAVQAGELDEQEARRQGEVFLQQAVALERPRHHRQQRVLVVEAARTQAARRQAFDPGIVRGADEHRAGVAEQLFVEAVGLFVGAVQVERQGVQRQAVERDAGAAAQADAQAGLGPRLAGGEAAEHRGGIAEVVGLGHFQRPQGHRVGGAVFAGGLVIGAELAAQEAPRSTLKPLLRAPSLGSGRNCTTVIDGVGAR